MANLIDLHNDAITSLSHRHFLRYIKKAKRAGVKTILTSVWTTEMTNPMERIRHYRQILDNINASIKLLLHIEDAWFLNEQNIHELLEYKPYSVGLTWNNENALAGGANSDADVTPLGEAVIKILADNNVHIDLAHLNRRSFYKVCDILKPYGKKLLCTHTCFDEVHPHPRNIDRAQVQTIVDSGGLVGLALVGKFLSPKHPATIQDVRKHISWFTENFGGANLALGTDFCGTTDLPKGLKGYKSLRRVEIFWKSHEL
ncbi:MAG: membrane dipeptidase [Christensenellaceae bacterium]|jgi:microsomal dipeptidase-like Zn-dependent dipeptidase|nr:membrane dipeptidase [Christensenellaceae bacterium]